MKKIKIVLFVVIVSFVLTAGNIHAEENHAVLKTFCRENSGETVCQIGREFYLSINKNIKEIFIAAYSPVTESFHDIIIVDGVLKKEYFFQYFIDGQLHEVKNGPEIFIGQYLKLLPDEVAHYVKKNISRNRY